MSYCRWSSDDWKCDIYAYESAKGYQIHVAGNRIQGDIPGTLNITESNVEEWVTAHNKQMDFIKTAERKPIGLPNDGESYLCETLEDFRNKLTELKETGYHIPKDVFDAIKSEIQE